MFLGHPVLLSGAQELTAPWPWGRRGESKRTVFLSVLFLKAFPESPMWLNQWKGIFFPSNHLPGFWLQPACLIFLYLVLMVPAAKVSHTCAVFDSIPPLFISWVEVPPL